MNQLQLFLPCAAGVEDYLAPEVLRITGLPPGCVTKQRGGVAVRTSLSDAMLLNLHSRLAQRVLVLLSFTEYRNEQDLYRAASEVAWERWFTPRESIKVEVTAQHSPLTSLNFVALKVKDAVCDRFRVTAGGVRPDVNTQWPDVRIYTHLSTDSCSLYIDTSGEPLFKRGWREDKGDAPLKETLAAAMLAASGWADGDADLLPLYDPCCGSGTIVIEAAQIACNIAPGSLRRFAFEKYLPFRRAEWDAIKKEAKDAEVLREPDQKPLIFGSDVAHRMVDFAQRNAQRAGVADVIEFRGGDALQRLPPIDIPGVMLLNPPYGERIEVAGVAKGARHAGSQFEDEDAEVGRFGARELPQTPEGGEFFSQLASHWKKNYPGWSAWILTPDLKLPSKMRLKESRRVPMWNGPIECRLFRFDMVKGSARST
ncbi:MAG: class I SAM-dependent RNA methyltransferase [Gammaproteobacteria bacterium]|uniref:THUMP domain-containing class I SAM-dependent RNA methyltransferase n=1 Tax=Rhodoferax sp. TaxID=50421 RepID=UPI0017EFFB5E|nr:class I SAM-dependent RNA methyltransferase [Rhodoferax sp.]MBU3898507.1 class I SAM-dependent RNA methyltransferase [Gammaproteobacteria bacterium]MBA3058868.1 class I SAM-dependent RNA methyltransferase [Rhodoferax sp.]MBU3997834.1 class I SAM-dependent RNA methyltransferase [Gammaproteobacteria bacterium]MBU4079282.1 class I SAM-dependent RNA methyltransferase [Gammaproteobacteria bacterium]MBU4115309.1 class I SAM-dependent RNA methyltransferase [Gammaproteobacteria bacterium]